MRYGLSQVEVDARRAYAHWRRMYLDGMSIPAIAAHYQACRKHVARHVFETFSPVMSTRGEGRRQEVWARALMKGMTIPQIARRWGVAPTTVHRSMGKKRILPTISR